MLSVLIVDDEKLARNTLQRIIPWDELGIDTIYEAGDGKAGLDIALQKRPAIIISDIKMPHMNGLEMATQIRENLLSAKLVFISGYTDKEYLKGAIHLHVDGYIEKPLDNVEITALLKRLVEEYKQNYLQENSSLYFYRENYDNTPLNNLEFILSKNDLITFNTSLKEGSYESSAKFLDDTYRRIKAAENMDTDYIKNSFRRLVLCIESTADTKGLTKVHNSCSNFVYSVSSCDTLKQIYDEVTSLLEMYYTHELEHEGDHVSQIHKYIESHYSNPDLSIGEIAKHLSFNTTYLSTVFKQSTGRTINGAITSARIEKAKELLKSTNLKLYQISERVGYRDGKYFTRIFTRETGISPREYRERHNATV